MDGLGVEVGGLQARLTLCAHTASKPTGQRLAIQRGDGGNIWEGSGTHQAGTVLVDVAVDERGIASVDENTSTLTAQSNQEISKNFLPLGQWTVWGVLHVQWQSSRRCCIQ